MRWFERQRMDWIAETIRIFGFINREHLVKKFEISVQQASKDLTTFQELHPEVMQYDKSEKCYVAKVSSPSNMPDWYHGDIDGDASLA